MANYLNQIQEVNGLKEGFHESSLTETNRFYLIRTDENGKNGYVRFNEKNYGVGEKTNITASGDDYVGASVEDGSSLSISGNVVTIDDAHEAISEITSITISVPTDEGNVDFKLDADSAGDEGEFKCFKNPEGMEVVYITATTVAVGDVIDVFVKDSDDSIILLAQYALTACEANNSDATKALADVLDVKRHLAEVESKIKPISITDDEPYIDASVDADNNISIDAEVVNIDNALDVNEKWAAYDATTDTEKAVDYKGITDEAVAAMDYIIRTASRPATYLMGEFQTVDGEKYYNIMGSEHQIFIEADDKDNPTSYNCTYNYGAGGYSVGTATTIAGIAQIAANYADPEDIASAYWFEYAEDGTFGMGTKATRKNEKIITGLADSLDVKKHLKNLSDVIGEISGKTCTVYASGDTYIGVDVASGNSITIEAKTCSIDDAIDDVASFVYLDGTMGYMAERASDYDSQGSYAWRVNGTLVYTSFLPTSTMSRITIYNDAERKSTKGTYNLMKVNKNVVTGLADALDVKNALKYKKEYITSTNNYIKTDSSDVTVGITAEVISIDEAGVDYSTITFKDGANNTIVGTRTPEADIIINSETYHSYEIDDNGNVMSILFKDSTPSSASGIYMISVVDGATVTPYVDHSTIQNITGNSFNFLISEYNVADGETLNNRTIGGLAIDYSGKTLNQIIYSPKYKSAVPYKPQFDLMTVNTGLVDAYDAKITIAQLEDRIAVLENWITRLTGGTFTV